MPECLSQVCLPVGEPTLEQLVPEGSLSDPQNSSLDWEDLTNQMVRKIPQSMVTGMVRWIKMAADDWTFFAVRGGVCAPLSLSGLCYCSDQMSLS